jgi:hypothetical protein
LVESLHHRRDGGIDFTERFAPDGVFDDDRFADGTGESVQLWRRCSRRSTSTRSCAARTGVSPQWVATVITPRMAEESPIGYERAGGGSLDGGKPW